MSGTNALLNLFLTLVNPGENVLLRSHISRSMVQTSQFVVVRIDIILASENEGLSQT